MEKKEYLYNFIGGGWSSEWAYTAELAIFQAKTRWKTDHKYVVDETTFRVSTVDDYNSLTSMFH